MADIQTTHFQNLRQPVHRTVSYCKKKQTQDDQNKIIMRIFGPKKLGVTGLRKLHTGN
jgi:hypothetical protein